MHGFPWKRRHVTCSPAPTGSGSKIKECYYLYFYSYGLIGGEQSCLQWPEYKSYFYMHSETNNTTPCTTPVIFCWCLPKLLWCSMAQFWSFFCFRCNLVQRFAWVSKWCNWHSIPTPASQNFLLMSFHNECGVLSVPFELHWPRVPSIQEQYSRAITFKQTTITFVRFYATLHWTFRSMWPTAFLALCQERGLGIATETHLMAPVRSHTISLKTDT